MAVWTVALSTAHVRFPPRQLVAEGFSTLAIVVMSVNLMLSTRAGFLQRRLHGLDKLFVTHRTLGLSVALLVTVHFLIVPKSVGYVASKPVGYTTIVLLLSAIAVASAPRMPWRRLVPLKYQTWKFSHRFMGVLVAMAATHSLLAHTYVRSVPLLAAYVYGIAAIGLVAWAYRELLFPRFGPFHSYQVESSSALSRSVRELLLAPDGPVPSRTAGQFVFLTFEDGPTREQHPFTVSNGPQEQLRFSIKSVGDFTEALLSGGVPDGSSVRVEGPYGAFAMVRGRRHQLWLAGGIGITPFLSMAEDLDDGTRVILVWSVATPQEAIYEQELARAALAKPNLQARVHPTSERGHFEVASLALETDACDYSAFVCGPLPMRKEFVRQLRSLGVPRSEIFFEEFRLR